MKKQRAPLLLSYCSMFKFFRGQILSNRRISGTKTAVVMWIFCIVFDGRFCRITEVPHYNGSITEDFVIKKNLIGWQSLVGVSTLFIQ